MDVGWQSSDDDPIYKIEIYQEQNLLGNFHQIKKTGVKIYIFRYTTKPPPLSTTNICDIQWNFKVWINSPA